MPEKEKRGLIRFDPFADFEWFPAFPRGRARDWFDALLTRGEGGKLLPAIDIAEDDGSYVVTAELPGTKREDVTVEVSEGMLTIRGEKKSEREEKKEQRRYVERSFGTFSRAFTLPSDADADRVQASFKDGVLTVTIAKAAEKKARTVDVKSA